MSTRAGGEDLPRVARFFIFSLNQSGKIYTKWPQNIPNGGKTLQMDLIVSKRPKIYPNFPFQCLQKTKL
jgi:hypothetical protein